jgi:cation transport protein ChaC
MASDPRDFWVFGYGSLMWDPGFPHVECRPARLEGYHRAFCIYSYRYRGTEARPGLVLGLKPGGTCLGRAFRVAARDTHDVLAYLEDREMTSYVYRQMRLPVAIGGRSEHATTYVADDSHPQYACGLSPEDTARLILRGAGERGPNIDYLENTLAHLEEMGVEEPALFELRAIVRRMAKT